jgi:hypothetical protein
MSARLWTIVAGGACAVVACAVSDPSGSDGDGPGNQTLPQSDAATSPADPRDACADANGCAGPVDCATVDFCSTPFPVSRLVAINAIWGSGPNDVWAVGSRGSILHGEGVSFTPVGPASTESWVAVWGTAPSDVWLLGSSAPSHATGLADGGVGLELRRGASWNAAKATTGRLWAGTSAGSQVVIAGEASERFGPVTSFWSSSADDAGAPFWSGMIGCSAFAPCRPAVRALWAADASSVWAVGREGATFFLDPTTSSTWLALDSRTRDDFNGVWGSSASDVWAVGRNGTIRHSSKGNAAWTIASSGTTQDLNAVWGSSPSDVWAVGDGGTLLHFDGTTWATASIGLPAGETPPHLFAIWGSGPDDVWIGGEGVLLHRTATSRRLP